MPPPGVSTFVIMARMAMPRGTGFQPASPGPTGQAGCLHHKRPTSQIRTLPLPGFVTAPPTIDAAVPAGASRPGWDAAPAERPGPPCATRGALDGTGPATRGGSSLRGPGSNESAPSNAAGRARKDGNLPVGSGGDELQVAGFVNAMAQRRPKTSGAASRAMLGNFESGCCAAG
jgi:hypothetical protein